MKNQKKILVLGSSGMLGSMVYRHLSHVTKFNVVPSSRVTTNDTSQLYLDAELLLQDDFIASDLLAFDYIINCIGVIKPYCKDDDPVGSVRAIRLNALFPHALSTICKNSPTRIIQIATDCVYSGREGSYNENSPHDALDVYGKTKSLGEVQSENLLNIRCSIIGPEQKGKLSLLEWFLAQKPGAKISGFTHHLWNGVTTLDFAKLCETIVAEDAWYNLRQQHHTHHFLPHETVNKFELLSIMNRVFERGCIIEAVGDKGPAVNRTLSSNFSIIKKLFPESGMQHAIHELARVGGTFGYKLNCEA